MAYLEYSAIFKIEKFPFHQRLLNTRTKYKGVIPIPEKVTDYNDIPGNVTFEVALYLYLYRVGPMLMAQHHEHKADRYVQNAVVHFDIAVRDGQEELQGVTFTEEGESVDRKYHVPFTLSAQVVPYSESWSKEYVSLCAQVQKAAVEIQQSYPAPGNPFVLYAEAAMKVLPQLLDKDGKPKYPIPMFRHTRFEKDDSGEVQDMELEFIWDTPARRVYLVMDTPENFIVTIDRKTGSDQYASAAVQADWLNDNLLNCL